MNNVNQKNFSFSLSFNPLVDNNLSDANIHFSGVIPPPPDVGNFLLLEGGLLILLNGQDMDLL